MDSYSLLDMLMVLLAAQIVRVYLRPYKSRTPGHRRWEYAAWGAYILLQYLIMLIEAEYPVLIFVTNILLVTMIQIFSCSGGVRTALFRSGVFNASWMAVEVITRNILLLIGTEGEHFFTVGNILSKLAMYIAVQLYGRWRGKDSGGILPLRHWAELFLIPVSSVFIIYSAYVFTLRSGAHAAFFVIAVMMILIDCIIFDVYEKMGRQALVERQNRIYKQEIRVCENQAAEREEAYQQTRILRHDLKNQMVAIGALLDADRTEEAANQIREMISMNSSMSQEISHSGNIALDALINYKYSVALAEGTVMECCIEVSAELPVEVTDLCSILGNLLDNALEAVRLLREEERRVSLTVRIVKDALLISVENPYAGEIVVDRQGRIQSSKTGDHGIGLISVERTAEKYGGSMSIKHENGVFRVSVLFCPD